MKGHVFEPKRWTSGPAYVQPKLNGVRALAQRGFFQSYEEIPWHPNVLKHLAEPLLDVFSDRHILDGELYVHGWPLQRINGAVQIARTEPREDTHLVEYHIFDLVRFESTFKERWAVLKSYMALFDNTKIKFVETKKVDSVVQADQFYADQVSKGYEGIMYRLGDCPYTKPKQPNMQKRKTYSSWTSRNGFLSDKNNRTWHLLKRKSWMDAEFICRGVLEGEGKRSGMVGSFICELDSHNRFGVGSGLSDAEATHYLQQPPIGRKIKVKFLCYTADGVPFNPTVEAIL